MLGSLKKALQTNMFFDLSARAQGAPGAPGCPPERSVGLPGASGGLPEASGTENKPKQQTKKPKRID